MYMVWVLHAILKDNKVELCDFDQRLYVPKGASRLQANRSCLPPLHSSFPNIIDACNRVITHQILRPDTSLFIFFQFSNALN